MYLRSFVLVVVAATLSCVFAPEPVGLVGCEATADCPPQHACAATLGNCVPADRETEVPLLLASTLEPTLVTEGEEVGGTLVPSEALALHRVWFELDGREVDVETTGGEDGLAFTAHMDSAGNARFFARLVDEVGNENPRIALGVVEVDGTLPLIEVDGVGLEAPAGSEVVNVTAATVGSRISANVFSSEALREAPRVTFVGDASGAVIDLVSFGERSFILSAVVPALPEGPIAVDIAAVDLAGNTAESQVVLEVDFDAVAPEIGDVLTLHRAPFGAAPAMEVSARSPLEAGSTLIVYRDAGGLIEIGRADAGGLEAAPRFLDSGDVTVAFAALVDVAGNRGAVTRVDQVALTVELGVNSVFENPHVATVHDRHRDGFRVPEGARATPFLRGRVTAPISIGRVLSGQVVEATTAASFTFDARVGVVRRLFGDAEAAVLMSDRFLPAPVLGAVRPAALGASGAYVDALEAVVAVSGINAFRLRDDNTWATIAPLPSVATFAACGMATSNEGAIARVGDRYVILRDLDGEWEPLVDSQITITSNFFAGGDLLFASGNDAAFVYDGATWTELTSGPVGCGAYDPGTDTMYAVGAGMLHRYDRATQTFAPLIAVGAPRIVFDRGADALLLVDEVALTISRFDGTEVTALDPEFVPLPRARFSHDLAFNPLTDEVLVSSGTLRNGLIANFLEPSLWLFSEPAPIDDTGNWSDSHAAL